MEMVIMAGTLVCAVAAAVISLQMPRVYEVSTVIEPGIASVKDSEGESFAYFSAKNISAKIAGGIYNRKVEDALQLNPLETKVEFNSGVVKDANAIRITSRWEEKTALGVKVTRQMIRLLSDDYAQTVEQRKRDYDNQISSKQFEISTIETQRKDIDKQIKLELSKIKEIRNQIHLQKATLENIRQRRGDLLPEIKGVKENTEKIVQQREALLKSESPGKDISLILYSTTIQQNVAYFNQLNNQLYDLDAEEKTIEAGIGRLGKKRIDDINTGIERLTLNRMEGLQTKIDSLNVQINKLSLDKGLISNIRIIQEPGVSRCPIKPKKKQIVILSVVVGLFFMIFLSFFIEYIKNATSSAKQTPE